VALSDTRRNNVLDLIHGVAAAIAVTGPVRLRQMTANGTATTNGTEVATGGGYTAGTGAPAITFAAATAGSAASSGAVTITNYPRAETVVGIETWNSNATPTREEWGALTASKAMQAGDTLSYAAGAVTSALA
jgi:hypothetical protein